MPRIWETGHLALQFLSTWPVKYHQTLRQGPSQRGLGTLSLKVSEAPMTISAGLELGLGLARTTDLLPSPAPSITGPPTFPSKRCFEYKRRKEMLPWNGWQPMSLLVGNFPIWEGVTSREDQSGLVRSHFILPTASVGVTGTALIQWQQSPAFCSGAGKVMNV